MSVVEVWVKGYRGSTRVHYPVYLGEFLKWVGLSADEVLRLRREDLESGDYARTIRFEGKVREWLGVLDEYGKGYSARLGRYTAIKSFFEYYDVGLRLRRRDAPKGEYERVRRPPTKAEIRVLLDLGDFYEKALILFLKDSGVAVCDLAQLRLKNFGMFGSWRDWLAVENAPIMVTGTRQKTRIKYKTFIGEESIEALLLYFEQREKGTQYLVKGTSWKSRAAGIPPERLGADSPLFAKKTSAKPGTPHFYTKVVEKICWRAGFRDLSAHCFRHYFQTNLESLEGLNPNWIRRMMGHKVSGKSWDAGFQPSTNPVYSHPEDNMLREAYRRGYQFLSVKPRAVDSERLRSLEEQAETLRAEREKDREDIERLKKLLDYFIERAKQEAPLENEGNGNL